MERRVLIGSSLTAGIAFSIVLYSLQPSPGDPKPVITDPAAQETTEPRPAPTPRPAMTAATPARATPDLKPPTAHAALKLDAALAHQAIDEAAAQFDVGFDRWSTDIPDETAEEAERIVTDLYAGVGEVLDGMVSGDRPLDTIGLRREFKRLQMDANNQIYDLLGARGMQELSGATGFGRQILLGPEAIIHPLRP